MINNILKEQTINNKESLINDIFNDNEIINDNEKTCLEEPKVKTI